MRLKNYFLFYFLNCFVIVSTAQIPTGYYNATNGLSCSNLKTALKNIITTGHTAQSYSALWSQFLLTDITPRPSGSGSPNVIWDIYSFNNSGTANYYFTPGTNQCGSYSAEGQCYNREHSFPASWFNDEAPAYTDYNHIFPTDGWVNNKRSNYRYGEVATASYTSTNGSKLGSSAVAGISGTVFEPINEFKGDLARAYLYMVTRYEDRISTWKSYSTDGALTLTNTAFPGVEINYLKLMIKWHNQDPVSAKEIARNNGTYTFQGNRNPFIDSPQFVNKIWNSSCPGLAALPVNIISFSGKLFNNYLQLSWEVENEINVRSYIIEQSFTGSSYSAIATVNANNSNHYKQLINIEDKRGRRVFYRLKKLDADGSYTYSDVFTIHIPLQNTFTVYPNPAKDFITIKNPSLSNKPIEIAITDKAGKTITKQIATVNTAQTIINISYLHPGVYFAQISHNNQVHIIPFIKQ